MTLKRDLYLNNLSAAKTCKRVFRSFKRVYSKQNPKQEKTIKYLAPKKS